jgi:hypothetical protein
LLASELEAKEAGFQELLRASLEAADQERAQLAAQLQGRADAAGAARAAAEQALARAQQELGGLKEQQRLDFERIGLLSEEHAALQVRPAHIQHPLFSRLHLQPLSSCSW